ncbi:transferrin receptor-like dimerization domain-containing protein [Rugamonas sp.]|uniref:transferrin receptor-like dimerization domain-containing protein n=1 Tax=Rugamonas sp. TaxID=1926287 RepID=UPI0025DD5607|nr:transferrin receptor-like dimerization domain-containing protein [Rugamonas sp.]
MWQKLTLCTSLLLAATAPTRAETAPASTSPDWEAIFRALPQPANIKETMRRMSARPHHVGSPYDKDNAEWLRDRFKEFGWDAQIETFYVLFPTPKTRLLEMTSPSRFSAKLEEPAEAKDPTSRQKSEQLPSYNAYSIDGDVRGPLVYVNYGRQQDYEELEKQGISVRGAIVIARYGESWRGIKPKVAAEHGAIGCIIYSDPRDDGYAAGDVFPDGPMRNKDGVQRGSVADLPTYPGDPLTPGVGATKDAKRLDIKDAKTLTAIPVLPISYGDAQPLLAAMTGPLAPPSWRGGLPITYHLGSGPAQVHLKLAFNWDIKPIYDVIATIPGRAFPDQWVIRGNHHDAWVNGADDPLSGMSAMLEEARALGVLLKQGWQPQRTIVYTAWDGEEPGLLGSTEWVEQHGDELAQKAVIYINTDDSGRGFLDVAGSHTLEKFINAVARDVEDPEAKVSLWKRWQAHQIVTGTAEERREARSRPDLRIDALGSGSDFTPFLQHNGVASLAIGFSGEDQAGVYHSVYDDFYHYTHFSDTDFVYGRALAQTAGTAVIRMADAQLMPFEFTDIADTVQTYITQIKHMLEQKQDEARERNREVEDGLFVTTGDPRHPTTTPKAAAVPPALNFAPLDNVSTALADAAQRYARAADKARGQLSHDPAALLRVNARLMQSERELLDPKGLPKREWYRHLLYAPGYYTGYAVKTMPGVRESIEQKDYANVAAEVGKLAQALQREVDLINGAAQDLEAIK